MHYRLKQTSLNLTFILYKNSIAYKVNDGDSVLISESSLGFNDIEKGYLASDLKIDTVERTSSDQDIILHFNEIDKWHENYNELTVKLVPVEYSENQISFNIVFRAYNEGIAFRYSFPEQLINSIIISDEASEFQFTENYQVMSESAPESGYMCIPLTETFTTLLPATLFNDNKFICIGEADNENYTRPLLSKSGSLGLKTYLRNGISQLSFPDHTPWRYVIVAKSAAEMINSKYLMYSLCPETTMDISWIKPGKVFRSMSLTTSGAYDAIDFCSSNNIEYMMFDAGWYGLGYGFSREQNPASDPMDVIDEIDMPGVTLYAENKGVGVILYVNHVALSNYDNIKMFELYKSWGIKGLKYGFVSGENQAGIKQVYERVKLAAEYGFIVNIHDRLRPSGLVRTYPNLMTRGY